MQARFNDSKTMYIKFPSVTKLQYPIQLIQDASARTANVTSYRQNFLRHVASSFNLAAKTQSFKIIRLPQKGEIMNICSMTVHPKEGTEQQGEQREDQRTRKKIFSVAKLSNIARKADNEITALKNPFKVGKSSSQRELKKVTPSPTINFDYLEAYPQVTRLIALSLGVVVEVGANSRMRKGKVDQSNNGFLVRQVIKKRLWWNVLGDEQMRKEKEKEREGEQPEYNVHLNWTPQILPSNIHQKLLVDNQCCMGLQEVVDMCFQRNFDKILSQLPKITQLFFTQWQDRPKRLKDWISKMTSQKIRVLRPDELSLNNHLPNHWELTDKKLLYRNMVNYYNEMGMDPHQHMPRTYHFTCFNWQSLVSELRSQQKVWILKPGENSNRGRGISVFRTTKEALDFIIEHPPRVEQRTLLLQEYISPLLYEERKFDIRCYMLGIQISGNLHFYMYQQGYVRTASEKYTTRKASKGIHLTNDAVQKHMANYDKFEPANKLSYNDLDKYCLNHTTFAFHRDILPKIRRITRDVCEAVAKKKLVGAGLGVSFQLFGLDYLVDDKGKPWLCQVNTNPSLEICCTLLSRIIPELLQNTFRLIDIILPGKKTPQYAQQFLTSNKYALLYSSSSNNDL